MAINALLGLPGSGKSYRAMVMLENALRHTDRHIYTNVFGLDVGQIAQDMHDRFGDSFKAAERIHIIESEQVRKFWTCRDIPIEDGDQPNFVGTQIQVLYLLDEIHIYFSAREWAKTGKGAIYYLSQHRKLGDEIVWMSQFPSFVEKQFRLLTATFTYMRNHTKEKILTYFKSYPWLSYSVYLELYTGTQTAMEVGRFRIDPNRYGKWYRTEGGVGIEGKTGADKNEKTKALPLWVLPASVVVAVGLVIYGLSKSSVWVTKAFVGTPPIVKDGVPVTHAQPKKVLPEKVEKPAEKPTQSAPPIGKPRKEQVDNGGPSDKVFMTGYTTGEGGVRVYLSDGREYLSGDRALLFVARDYCIVQHEGRSVSYRVRNMQELFELRKNEEKHEKYASTLLSNPPDSVNP